MSAPGSFGWFASHEARLAWRDWAWLMTRGKRRRGGAAGFGFLGFFLFAHGFAYLVLSHSMRLGGENDTHERVIITAMLALAFSAMLSQAMESVTRAFYARGDLELILTSPATTSRLFAVRIAAIAATNLSMFLLFAAPFINVQAWLGGMRWLCAYPVVMALSALGRRRNIDRRRALQRHWREAHALHLASHRRIDRRGLRHRSSVRRDRIVRHDDRSPLRRAGQAGA